MTRRASPSSVSARRAYARHLSEAACAITSARPWQEGGSGVSDATFLQCLSAYALDDVNAGAIVLVAPALDDEG